MKSVEGVTTSLLTTLDVLVNEVRKRMNTMDPFAQVRSDMQLPNSLRFVIVIFHSDFVDLVILRNKCWKKKITQLDV